MQCNAVQCKVLVTILRCSVVSQIKNTCRLRTQNLVSVTSQVWTCHEERPRICRKKDDGNGGTGKEKKRETKEKIFRCSERRYGESWCKRDRC